ncbi:hypothetical protein PPYR_01767 [Photinus pyralis]|uniref:GDP-fucose protein O-fucosyltransferase 2 n=1 Tax=Photinus pyralis TaxID=7054 RepID=A0A1Y1MFF9_PHOPY|nr:GDP-fucose protein O-fucosyltransferase 2 [Photinus pyralis]KAB0804797.1 hypothetical protein PPYR_01767 [Photinus pyralis]
MQSCGSITVYVVTISNMQSELFKYVLFTLCFKTILMNDVCEMNTNRCEPVKYRYVFYDINPPEGFNLRRDVYMRFAIFVHKLKQTNLSNFKLVLPPWIRLYHWNKQESVQIPWSHFFDLNSLKQFAPVIEMYDFFNEINVKYSKIKIDQVYILQHYKEMFDTGKFEDKMQIEKCATKPKTNFYFYNNITSDSIKCLSFHGQASHLKKVLEESNAQTILFDHAEVALHDHFGNDIYWKARRSMRFNKELKKLAADFRQKYLNSSDQADGTMLPEDWQKETGKRAAKGGPYLSVHLRRRDFALGRPNDVPSIHEAASQITKLLQQLSLRIVFIATDSTIQEYTKLEGLLSTYKVYRFLPVEPLTDGAVAVIDQIICSHAQFFVGTHESTFTFRIQEEREIMGFPEHTTFNRLCGNRCEKPSVWKIVY